LQLTNQKAELSAIIQAVHRFGYNLHIITDSQYAMSCFTIWYQKWIGSNRPLIELGLQLGANNATFAKWMLKQIGVPIPVVNHYRLVTFPFTIKVGPFDETYIIEKDNDSVIIPIFDRKRYGLSLIWR